MKTNNKMKNNNTLKILKTQPFKLESYILAKFLKRVNRLSKDNPATADEIYGRVTFHSKARTANSKRIYGSRKFNLSKSQIISNGTYTLPTLRAKLTAAISA
jgi:hypothetical protein